MAKHTKDGNGKHKHNEPGFGDWVNNNALIIGFLIGAVFLALFALSGVADLAGWIARLAG